MCAGFQGRKAADSGALLVRTITQEAPGQPHQFLGIKWIGYALRVGIFINNPVIDRSKSGSIGISQPAYLNGRRFAGE